MKARQEEFAVLSCGHSTEVKQALQLERQDSLPEQRLDPKLTLPGSSLSSKLSAAGATLTFTFLRSVMAGVTRWRDDMRAEMLSERRHSCAAYNRASDGAEQRTQEA